MKKEYRIEYEKRNTGEIHHGYQLISAENEHAAGVEFSKGHDNIRFNILAVDKLDPATITSMLEGPDLITIPVLQHLPRELVIVRPADSPACEWGWGRKVWRDAEGHYLADNLKVVGCRCYMEDPPQGGPYYLVETADCSLGLYLCQEHLDATLPQWTQLRRGVMRKRP